jgi:predicted alpha/beta hydrolase family esterase
MTKQVLVIHGGTTFDSQEDYINYLKTKELSFDRLCRELGWKDLLGQELGERFIVLNPKMPNSTNARYEEWKIWFERIYALLDKKPILIGHSLGGIFLAKYLAENDLPHKAKALILVAAPFKDESQESLADFALPDSLENINKQVDKIFLIHSQDDLVVDFAELAGYKKSFIKRYRDGFYRPCTFQYG